MKKLTIDKKKWYIIRADKAGVFIGQIKSFDNGVAEVTSLRRLYYSAKVRYNS